MPSLPSVSSNIPRDLRQFLDRVREKINGTGQDEIVTVRKLVASGLAEYTNNALVPAGNTTFYGTPPAPQNLEAQGALANVIVSWDRPVYNGHAYTEVWAAQQTAQQAAASPEQFPDLGEAQLVGMAPGSVWVHNLGEGASRWYWIRFVNVEGEVGAYNAVDGVRGDTGTDPTYLLDLLTGELADSHLSAALNDRLDLIDGSETLTGSVNNRIAVVQGQVNQLLNLPAWSSTETYAADDQVTYSGGLYVATQASTNVLPTNTSYWTKIGDYTTLGDAVAAHTVQISALEDDLGTLATESSTLAAQLRGNYTGDDISLVSAGLIYNERVARTAADTALASEVSTLNAFVNTKSRVFYQATEPQGTATEPLNVGDMWIDTNITYAADYIEGDYVIQSNRMYRYDGTNWVEAMDFGFADWFSAIRTEKEARITEDESLAAVITALQSSTNNSFAGISSTLATATSDIVSNANAITNLTSVVSTNNTSINAALQTEATTRATEDAALSTTLTALGATVAANDATLTANIQSEATARATADTSLSQRIDTLSATVTQNNTTLSSAISQETAARTTADETNASAITALQSTVDNNDTSIRASLATEATTRATQTGELYAQYTVKVDVNGYVSGYGLASTLRDGVPTSEFIVKSDTFAVAYPGSTEQYPFIIRTAATTINGETVPAGVYIRDGFIQNGTITNAKIGNAAIDRAKIANAAIGTAQIENLSVTEALIANASITNTKIKDATIQGAKIQDGTITNALIQDGTIAYAKIENTIESYDYSDANKTGWRINKYGSMIMNNATFRGAIDIQGASGTNRLNITGNKIEVIDSNNVVRVRIGNLS